MSHKKIVVEKSSITFRNPYSLVYDAVENGVRYGLGRAVKHTDWVLTEEQETTLFENVSVAVMNELSELLSFWSGEQQGRDR